VTRKETRLNADGWPKLLDGQNPLESKEILDVELLLKVWRNAMDPSKVFDDVCGSRIYDPSSSSVPYMYGDRRRYLA